MTSLTNHFLVAMPNQTNNMFAGSVVYLTEHASNNGTVGVIINKPLARSLKNAFKNVDFSKYHPQWTRNNLYLGGPVSGDNGFILYRTIADNNKIFDLTNDKKVLSQIAISDYKNDLFVAVGYSSWSAMQLECEILRNDWLVVKADAGLIFEVDPANRYNEALRLLGIKNLGQLYSGVVVA